eukprot:SAG31_NODE_194_length_20722_cov_19.854192_26_plen_72_part_00
MSSSALRMETGLILGRTFLLVKLVVSQPLGSSTYLLQCDDRARAAANGIWGGASKLCLRMRSYMEGQHVAP